MKNVDKLEDDISEKKFDRISICSYLTVLGWLLCIFLSDDNRSQHRVFHLKQSLGIWILYYLVGRGMDVLDFVSSYLSFSFYLCWVFLFLFGFITAFSRKLKPIPILGKYFQKYFNFIEQKPSSDSDHHKRLDS